MTETPETRYAQSGGVHIAYQVTGMKGPGALDLVLVPGFVSHLDNAWETPLVARFLDRLGAFARLICFDKRGTGLSDRTVGIATLEERMDDVRAVMDAVGSERTALLGLSEGGPMCMLFAATYPERVSALAMYGTFARAAWAPDLPWNRTVDERGPRLDKLVLEWGTGIAVDAYVPSKAGDDPFRKLWAAIERTGASPGSARALIEMNYDIDARPVLASIRVPTLVIHRTGDRVVKVENGRDVAARIPGARYVELEGIDHWPFLGADPILDELEMFFTGVRGSPDPDRVLATVLFTDIVGSTERAAALGDRQWRDLLAEHHKLVRRALERYRGREVDTTGDAVVRSRSVRRSKRSAFASVPASTPGSARCWGTTSAGSPCTSRPASRYGPKLTRSSSRAPYGTSSPALGSPSTIEAAKPSRASPGSGICSRSQRSRAKPATIGTMRSRIT